MKIFHIIFAVGTVILLSVGQILFKQASAEIIWSVSYFYKNLSNFKLILAMFVYAIATLMWLFVLKNMPLNMAYSFIGIGFFVVPILSYAFLGEPLRWNVFLGALFIVIGIIISNHS
jgi:multidrug transporter EmrE-like cation transporter